MPTTPTTTSTIDMTLAAKGRNQPLGGLLEQAKVSALLAKTHAAALAPCGWPKARTDRLATEIDSLETDFATKLEAANVSRHATAQEYAAIDAAKTFIRKLRAVAPMVLRDTKVAGIPHEALNAGGTLGRSVSKIVIYLTKARVAVAPLDADFAPYFHDASATALLDDVKKALDGADAEQEVKLSALPKESLAMYETKGRVLEAIEDLNRCAKVAFDGDAGTRSAFNKDILLRARKALKAEPATDATDTTTTTTTATGKTTTTSPTDKAPKAGKTETLEPAHA